MSQLEAWASFGHGPILGVSASGFGGDLVKHLPAGTYHVSGIAMDALGFELVGPGLVRRTPIILQIQPQDPFHKTHRNWTIRLRRGLYRYRLIGAWAGDYHPAIRSFRLP